jgi:hypothetical protein
MTYHDEPAPEPTNAQLLAHLQQLSKTIRALAAHVGMDPVLLLVEPAEARDLDSEWGNPTIDRTPKNWTGEPVEGRQFSDLQPATLRALARHYASLAEWHDSKGNVDAKGRPKSGYARRDAGRALGWALRLEAQGHRGPKRPQHREERHPAEAPPDLDGDGSDDIPF